MTPRYTFFLVNWGGDVTTHDSMELAQQAAGPGEEFVRQGSKMDWERWNEDHSARQNIRKFKVTEQITEPPDAKPVRPGSSARRHYLVIEVREPFDSPSGTRLAWLRGQVHQLTQQAGIDTATIVVRSDRRTYYGEHRPYMDEDYHKLSEMVGGVLTRAKDRARREAG